MTQLADRASLERLLASFGVSPQKKFGQNFLVDPAVLTTIIDAGELTSEDNVVEIGAGPGVLTQALAERAKNLTALEYDNAVFPLLKKNLATHANAELLNLDVRKFSPPERAYKLIANIPYYLTSPILRQFFVETVHRPSIAVLLIQREVAEKIVDDRMSVLAWQVRIFGKAEIIRRVPRESFLPPPKVESAVIRIRLRGAPLIAESDVADFFKLLHAGFRAPRKKISASLAAGLPYGKDVTKKIFEAASVDSDLRPERLEFEDWLRLLASWRTHRPTPATSTPRPKKAWKEASR